MPNGNAVTTNIIPVENKSPIKMSEFERFGESLMT